MGRVSEFTPEKAQEIIERIQSGASNRELLACGLVTSNNALYTWLANNQDFRERYVKAKEISAFHDENKLQDIATDCLEGAISPAQAKTGGDILFRLAKVKQPKRFHEALVLKGDSELPVAITINKFLDK